jgi:hypothetical protein
MRFNVVRIQEDEFERSKILRASLNNHSCEEPGARCPRRPHGCFFEGKVNWLKRIKNPMPPAIAPSLATTGRPHDL